jgi:hypothetical protein
MLHYFFFSEKEFINWTHCYFEGCQNFLMNYTRSGKWAKTTICNSIYQILPLSPTWTFLKKWKFFFGWRTNSYKKFKCQKKWFTISLIFKANFSLSENECFSLWSALTIKKSIFPPWNSVISKTFSLSKQSLQIAALCFAFQRL